MPLPQNIRLQSDEMLSSWLETTKEINMLDDRSMIRIMTGREGTIRMHGRSYPSGLERLCSAVRANGGTEADIPGIVRNNTLFFIELPFLKAGEQARTLEFILRGSSIRTLTNRPSQDRNRNSQMICPVCAEEDKKRCGRAYIHVPHQVSGITACYRHGCRLLPAETLSSGEEPETAEDTEAKIARFYYGIYKDPVCTDDRIRSLSVGDALEKQGETIGSFAGKNRELIKCGEPVKTWHSLTEGSKRRFLAAVFGYSADRFRKAAEEFSNTDEIADVLKEISGNYGLLSPYGPVMYLECRQCGTRFYTHPGIIRLGAGCPVCDSTLPEETVIDRYVRRHGDGEYEIARTETGTKIVHRPCGTETRSPLSYFIFRNGDCPVCAGKKRIGETGTNSDGQRMTITGYNGCFDVQVRFDDGTVVSHRTYQQFKRGTVENPNDNFKTRRVGLEGVSVTGRKMKVAGYRGGRETDVVFEDGTVVRNQKFENFLSGKILHPDDLAGNKTGFPVIKGTRIYDPSVREGENGTANSGQPMQIIRYRNARDMDVRFDDGTEVSGITYSHFLQGRVGNPSRQAKGGKPERSRPRPVILRYRQEREGKAKTNRYGEEMKIIRYGSSKDIDVQFGSGSVVKHRTYADFLNDSIKNPDRERKMLEEKWLGQTGTARNGMEMEVTAYRKHDDADIRFEDGTVVEHVSLKHFRDGSIQHPGMDNPRVKKCRIGERSEAKNGQMMTIAAYRGAGDIDIRFEDGTVVKGKSYDHFRTGTVRHPLVSCRKKKPVLTAGRIGETRTASDGSKIKIIAFRGYEDIDVEFEDGTVSQHRQYMQFKRGEIRNPGSPHGLSRRQSRLGEPGVMKNGLSATIIAYRNNKDIDVRFENGIVRKHMCYSNFVKGNISSKTQ